MYNQGDQRAEFPVLSRGGGYALMWPIRGRAAGQGMFFGRSVLNRVFTFMLVLS